MIRTMIVDDSAVVRAMLKQVMGDDPRFQVVCMAENGEKAVQKALENEPDLIVMDYHMPVMDGLMATKEIFSRSSTPPAVVMFSTEQDSSVKDACRKQGVLEFVEKPSLVSMTSEQLTQFCDTLSDAVSKKHNYFMLRDALQGLSVPYDAKRTGSITVTYDSDTETEAPYSLVLIGASTGGPEAVQQVVRQLGPDFPLPVLVTQHIDTLFDQQFTAWLKHSTGCNVTLAKDGETAEAGHVYVAPAEYHLLVEHSNNRYILRLAQTPPVHFLRPAVDEMFFSAARVAGQRCIAALLTGMGRDGAAGMEALKKQGAVTICQNEATCVVFGMPKAAIDIHAASAVLPLEGIAPRISQLAGWIR